MFLLNWIFSIPFLILFVLNFIVFSIIQLLLFPFGENIFHKTGVYFNKIVLLLMKLTGAKFEISVPDSLKNLDQIIVIANHQSLMDLPFLVTIFERFLLKFTTKKALAKNIPFVSFRLRHGGHILIERHKGGDALNKINSFVSKMKETGYSFGIFPEGTRARDGKLKKFKTAGIKKVIELAKNIPVVTFTIDGSWKYASYKLMPVPFGTTFKVKVGEPKILKEGQSVDEFLEEIEEEVRRNLASFRR